MARALLAAGRPAKEERYLRERVGDRRQTDETAQEEGRHFHKPRIHCISPSQFGSQSVGALNESRSR